MKQIYILALTTIFSFANAQELITNGSFENWTEGNPDGWTISIPENGGSVVQSNDAQEGSSSAQITAPMGTGNVRIAHTDFEVTPGEEYTFSYYYKDLSDDARLRHWASWRDGSGSQLDNNLDILQPQNYNENTNGWQQVTFTLTAPANAAKFRLDFRTYREGDTGGGIIFLDNVSFKGSNMSVTDLNNSVKFNTVWTNNVNFSVNGNAVVEIFNLNGQLVQKAEGANTFNVNVSGLQKGAYVVKVTVDGVATTQKVIKK